MEDTTKSLKNLKSMFDLTSLDNKVAIQKRFDEIAKELFENYVIKAYEYSTETKDYSIEKLYRFVDIEFYYSTKCHKDYVTHPRKGEALRWYVNDFGGIDINFKSKAEICYKDEKNNYCGKYYWDNSDYYGGILIRQIELISKCGKTLPEEEKILMNGPLKVAELFRDFNAFDGISKCPQLTRQEKHTPYKQDDIDNCVRHGLVEYKNGQFNYEKKLSYIQSWFKGKDDLTSRENIERFHHQVNREYRYCYSEFNKYKRESTDDYYKIPVPMGNTAEK